MGMNILFTVDNETGHATDIQMPAPGLDQLAFSVTLARPFTLAGEAIYGPNVSKSLVRFAQTAKQRTMAEQVGRMWRDQPFNRLTMFASKRTGEAMLPPEGVSDGHVADRVLYSQLVHADDAREVLDHVDDDTQRWSLAGVVGDWLAVIAHQQAQIHWIRPDICPVVTPWAGSPETIFDRLGVTPLPEV